MELFARGSDVPGAGVPYLRSDHPNTVTALDISPNGRPTGGATVTGASWLHVVNRDLKGLREGIDAEANIWQAALVSCRFDAA